jgi:tetratricopeptide (TPR) repeat protein
VNTEQLTALLTATILGRGIAFRGSPSSSVGAVPLSCDFLDPLCARPQHSFQQPLLGELALAAKQMWAVLTIGVGLGLVADLRAQCPDGSAPPCRSSRPPPPSLDQSTWIVLPFANVSRAPELEWLRDGSVNLLYLDLSRWQDIRVIDDERVADFLRRVPDAKRSKLSLETALEVARRAGAGRLVMGDLLRVGNRTAVVAKVYDVRRGQRLRSVQGEIPVTDSAMAVFGRLAWTVLDVDSTAIASLGTVGTASVEAYREYVAGVRALNRWELEEAQRHFSRGIDFDSTFAMAHYKMSVALAWSSSGTPEEIRAHAEAAARHTSGLAYRERQLIAGWLAQGSEQWVEACGLYKTLLERDSTDVEAWYNLGECSFQDDALVRVSRDTSQFRFRSSWNTALHAFRRALELDPSYHLAYGEIEKVLRLPARAGCLNKQVREEGQRSCGRSYVAIVAADGDSLVTAPQPLGEESTLQRRLGSEGGASRLPWLRDIAAAWVAAAPDEWRARLAHATVLLESGDPQDAAAEARVASRAARPIDRQLPDLVLAEALLKSEQVAAFTQLVESLTVSPGTRGISGAGLVYVGLLNAVLGRFDRCDRLVMSAWGRDPFRAVVRVGAGIIPDSLSAFEDDLRGQLRERPQDLQAWLAPTTLFGFRMRGVGPALHTSSANPRIRIQALLASGDSARAKGALALADSVALATPPVAPDYGEFLLSAEAHLALGDSATALVRLEEFERRWISMAFIGSQDVMHAAAMASLGRTWLLLADLELAAGRSEVAARAYRRVIALWEGGDTAVQPFVARARVALERMNVR